MKPLIAVLLCLMTSPAFADLSLIKVACASLENDPWVQVIHVNQTKAADGTLSLEGSYMLKQVSVSLKCKSDGSELPNSLSCESAESAQASVRVWISSADGVLNIGELTVDGQKSQLHCHAEFSP